MKILALFLLSFTVLFAKPNSCLSCHNGIENIREPHSGMMKAIYGVAKKTGYIGNDCIVCHGGNPTKYTKEQAHSGTINYFKTHEGPKDFYPAPGSTWINKNTCGMCHKEQVAAQMSSLMQSEGGKIQGALWAFGRSGIQPDGNTTSPYRHMYGDFNVTNEHQRFGTEIYQKYMKVLSKKEPQGFEKKVVELPPAPTADAVEKDPSLAVYTYLRQECLRCHTASKGRYRRGDYRGVGCASCHVPYSNEGFYEGNDTSINKTERGHMLVHSIQSSREAKVTVHGHSYSGIPVETCSTCHNRGKRIGVSYQGLMETAYKATFDGEGNAQPKLHTKRYLHLQEDVHYKYGMLCQDCHTSNDMHGDGFLSGANLGAVEIECQDCHGTTKKYPWELPLGYSDEFSTKVKTGAPRGTTKSVAAYLKMGHVEDAQEGHLLSARGNPLVHTARVGDKVIVHLSSGKDLELKPLKTLKKEHKLSKKALVAMDKIAAHTDKMECYTCHAKWAPQCYGCHVKIDYSHGKQNPDYLAASHDHDLRGVSGGMREGKSLKEYLIDGKVTETRSYLRWEDPALAQNGEGRITPVIPGCQVTVSVIGKNGKALLQNHIFQIPGVEGAEGNATQNAIDMSPVQPHTISKESRSCESCHTSKKALGMGIGDGKYFADQRKDFIVDLMDADGNVLPQQVDEQIPGIKNIKADYSKFLDENGTQLMTVGHHWKLSGPLNKQVRDKLDREGACLSCHATIPEGDLAVSAMAHMAQMAGVKIDNKEHHTILSKIVKLSAWVQVLAGVIIGGVFVYLFMALLMRKKERRWK